LMMARSQLMTENLSMKRLPMMRLPMMRGELAARNLADVGDLVGEDR
jgi:hypothetical protein